jgi:hypothetical protein
LTGNAGLENDGQDVRGGKCRTGKLQTKSQVENAGQKFK